MDKVYYEKCKNRLIRISNSMLYTNQAYFVIMQLRDFQEKHNKLINISPAFYNFVSYSCREVLFVEINIMFDHNKKSDGIVGLLNSIQGSINLLDTNRTINANETKNFFDNKMDVRKYDNITQLVEESLKKVQDQQIIINRIKTLRDKYYAHFETNVNSIDLFKDNPVSLLDIESLLLLNTNIVNALYMYFNETTLFPRTVNYDDFKKTITFIQKGAESIRKQYS